MHPTDTYPRQVCPYCGSTTEPIGDTPILSNYWACISMNRETITDYQIAYLEALNLTDRFSREKAVELLVKPSHILYLCGDWQDEALIKRAPIEWGDWDHLMKQLPKPWLDEAVERLSPTHFEDVSQAEADTQYEEELARRVERESQRANSDYAGHLGDGPHNVETLIAEDDFQRESNQRHN